MIENKLFNYLDIETEILLTGDINPLAKELGTSGIVDKDCINIYIEGDGKKLMYSTLRKKGLFKFMRTNSLMKNRKYIVINLLTKDRLKIQAMMSLGFSFEDSLYELYIKDKEPVLHSYS